MRFAVNGAVSCARCPTERDESSMMRSAAAPSEVMPSPHVTLTQRQLSDRLVKADPGADQPEPTRATALRRLRAFFDPGG